MNNNKIRVYTNVNLSYNGSGVLRSFQVWFQTFTYCLLVRIIFNMSMYLFNKHLFNMMEKTLRINHSCAVKLKCWDLPPVQVTYYFSGLQVIVIYYFKSLSIEYLNWFDIELIRRLALFHRKTLWTIIFEKVPSVFLKTWISFKFECIR